MESYSSPRCSKKICGDRGNESVDDRVERFKKILNVKKSDVETKTLKAELNILSENFPEARRAISDLIETDQANAKVYTLMAAIEKGVGSSDAVVKGWLAKALQLSDQKGGFALTVIVKANGNPFVKNAESSQRSNGEKRYET